MRDPCRKDGLPGLIGHTAPRQVEEHPALGAQTVGSGGQHPAQSHDLFSVSQCVTGEIDAAALDDFAHQPPGAVQLFAQGICDLSGDLLGLILRQEVCPNSAKMP